MLQNEYMTGADIVLDGAWLATQSGFPLSMSASRAGWLITLQHSDTKCMVQVQMFVKPTFETPLINTNRVSILKTCTPAASFLPAVMFLRRAVLHFSLDYPRAMYIIESRIARHRAFEFLMLLSSRRATYSR